MKLQHHAALAACPGQHESMLERPTKAAWEGFPFLLQDVILMEKARQSHILLH
jgi:hypothetical protein